MAELLAAVRDHGGTASFRVRAMLPDTNDWPDVAIHVDKLVFVLSERGLRSQIRAFMQAAGVHNIPQDADDINLDFLRHREYYPHRLRQLVDNSGGEMLEVVAHRHAFNQEPSFFVRNPATGALVSADIDVSFERGEIHVRPRQELFASLHDAWMVAQAGLAA